MARPPTSPTGLYTGRPSTSAARTLSGAREPCRVAAVANVGISAGGLLVIDGVQLVAGDRVLLTAQTDASENGIYTASAGAWYRATDARDSRSITKGVRVMVQQGTAYSLTEWEFRTFKPLIGTDGIVVINLANEVSPFGFGVLRMLTIGGTNNAVTATFNPTYVTRKAGQLLRVRFVLANSAAMTLAADAIAAAPIKMPDGSAVPSGAVQANTDYLLEDDGTNYVIRFSNITF